MKTVGLKFILKDGTFITAVVTESDAQRYIDGFIKGSLPPVIGYANVPTTQTSWPWAVRVDTIYAVHTMAMESPQPGMSGFRYN